MNGDDLYQEVILDHARRPRNKGKLCHGSRCAQGVNPLCGDQIHVCVDVQEGAIRCIRFDGQGCAISTASASLMTEAVQGRSPEEALALSKKVLDLVTGRSEDRAGLGKLVVLQGVARFPSRVKCAALAWHALEAALHGENDLVTSE
ncbi:MAG: Fe-S cluster assembly sulfur transfer protein SufU [Pseudomonadota bacterium]